MRRLVKSSPLGDKVRPFPSAAPQHRGALVWRCQDDKGNHVERSIEMFAVGRPGRKGVATITPRPSLAADLAASVMEMTRGKSKGPYTRALAALTEFWTFLDAYEDDMRLATGQAFLVSSAAQVDDAMGALFKMFLIRTSRASNSILITVVADIVSFARERHHRLSPLAWPIIEQPTAPTVHRDVSQWAIHRLRAYCVRKANATHPLERAGVSPIPRLGEAHDLYDRNAAAAATKAEIEERILETGNRRDTPVRRRFEDYFAGSRPSLRRNRYEGYEESKSEYMRLFVPDALEAIAAYVVVAIDTGWLDTAKNIDITGPWFIDKAEGGPSEGVATLVVNMNATRPKTGALASHLCPKGRNTAFGVLARRKERTAYARDLIAGARQVLFERMMGQNDPDLRRQIDELDAVARSPFIHFSRSSSGPGFFNRIGDAARAWSLFEDLKAELLATPAAQRWTREQIESVKAIRISDLRDAFAARVYEESGYNLFAVKRALTHKNTASTARYLRQRHQQADLFRRFGVAVEVMFDEVKQGYLIDPRVLMARAHTGQDKGISEDMRRALKGPVTRVGMHCANPTSPPPEIAPGHRTGQLCSVQRCVLCKHGFFFPEEPGAMEALAERLGELAHARSVMPANMFETSMLRVEIDTVEAARDTFYRDRTERFRELAAGTVREIESGLRGMIEATPSTEMRTA